MTFIPRATVLGIVLALTAASAEARQARTRVIGTPRDRAAAAATEEFSARMSPSTR